MKKQESASILRPPKSEKRGTEGGVQGLYRYKDLSNEERLRERM